MYPLNYPLAPLPERTIQPRTVGITMVMDKGLGRRAAEDLIDNAAPYFDYIKLGWSTALFVRSLSEKLALYKNAGIKPYFGGTLWEAFYVRQKVDDFLRFLDAHGVQVVEISDGSIDQPHEEKLHWIRFFAERGYEVLSEVGSKDATKVLPPFRWIELIRAELEAGSRYVIAEARESGTVGMYRSTGEVREGLVEEVVHHISWERLIFEAPQRVQQAWFIRRLGTNVNLGNIAPEEIISVETMRLGLRGDTFHTFLERS